MEKDLFSAYIQNLTKSTPQTRYEVPVQKSETVMEQSCSLDVLREISRKLDKLDDLGKTLEKAKSMESLEYVEHTVDADIAILYGKVVLPDQGVFRANIYIKDGKIVSIGQQIMGAKKMIDASNRYVLPGIIDPHVHLGLFAPMQTELSTETKSAIMGGITTIGCYLGGQQSHFTSFLETMEQIQKYSYTDVIPHLVISTEEQKKEMQDYITHLGVTSFKIYMNGIPGLIPDVDDGFIWEVLGELKKSQKECILCAHAENRHLVAQASKAVANETGEKATIADWSDTHPDMAEEEAVTRLSYLAEKSGVPVYFVHMTSKAAIERLRKMKPFNDCIHVETTSPYLSLTRHSTSENMIKMEPPFRDSEDVEALWKAVEDGVVDTIGTDNVTMTKTEKSLDKNMWDVVPGYPALETHLTVLLHEGVVKRGIPIEKLVTHITKRPAETFGVYPQKGTLLPGSDADIVIVDMQQSKEIHAGELHSRSDFSLYDGKRLQGVPVMTIQKGKVMMENGVFIGEMPSGTCLER